MLTNKINKKQTNAGTFFRIKASPPPSHSQVMKKEDEIEPYRLKTKKPGLPGFWLLMLHVMSFK
jgi:hypothetical protein